LLEVENFSQFGGKASLIFGVGRKDIGKRCVGAFKGAGALGFSA
jgi:hypothetical protein